MSRQRISGLSSAGAWDSIWHTHIFCASPTVSVTPGLYHGDRHVCSPISSSRAGDHELTWLGRDSMSFADVGEDAEAGGVQLHRRRRQLQGGSGPSDRSARHRTIKCRVPKMSTWWDHLNIILPHVCAIQVCIYVDGGSYDDPKIDWLEADPFKWSVIIDLVWNRCCSVGYLW